MTRRELLLLLTAAANEPSKEIIRRLYAQGRGRRDRGKLAPTTGTKTPKIRRKGATVATKNGLT